MNPDQELQIALKLRRDGRHNESVACLGRILAKNPTYAEAVYYLALSLDEIGKPEQAVEVYKKAIELAPTMAKAWSNMGGVLCGLDRLDESVAACRQAIRLEPNLPQAYNNLGNAVHYAAKVEEAAECYKRAAMLDPREASYASSYLHTIHFDPARDAMNLLAEHQDWNRRYADPLKHLIRPHENDRNNERRLRIGYVSQNLDSHVVGVSMVALLGHHDRKQFEVFCYSSNFKADVVTDLLRPHADTWRDISRMSDDQAADLIRADQIDILVDLSLHTGRNRLLIFARKPAPVQVSYLGYCGTTGMSAIDWRLSDPFLDPLEVDLKCYTERTMRLPASYWCYQPRKSPDVLPSPMLANGFVTFGCLNTYTKVSRPALDLWAKILLATPRWKLIVHASPGSHREEVLKHYSSLGVAPERVEFVGKQNWTDYLKTYHRIDIALDPFPYGGGITTFDALWMGVPVVTLSGRTGVGRGGRSILSNIGLPAMIARTPEEYVRIAADAEKWIPHRKTMRQRMQASPAMDAPRLARDVEAAYRVMWKDWLGK